MQDLSDHMFPAKSKFRNKNIELKSIFRSFVCVYFSWWCYSLFGNLLEIGRRYASYFITALNIHLPRLSIWTYVAKDFLVRQSFMVKICNKLFYWYQNVLSGTDWQLFSAQEIWNKPAHEPQIKLFYPSPSQKMLYFALISKFV
jgi:hypothetical protein